ncbi:glycosyltransferase family 4 protein [Spirosoma sp. RP8]|uniref:Glycosyltransferase family 4 protein n=1 Tax=Spirosoma liriopis TaxID=2937440 RepID=A0ABT0HG28_9BACT|nr:glycosyltransferase family 4 protein [Spirosoma liriopis]MCK8490960.1 glycosyltransferase family 4 protein [Spirosoma liriopis]
MNVLIVTVLASHSPSGVVTYYNTLAQDLRNQGVQVSIVDASDTPFLWRKVLAVLFRIMPLFGNAGRALYYEFAQFTGMYMAIRSKKIDKPDLIHAQDAKSGAAAHLALGEKVPVVMTCHFNDDPASEIIQKYKLKTGLAARFVKWYTYLFSHIKSYVFVSNYAYSKSKHLLPADANRIILYNTVSIKAVPSAKDLSTANKLIISNVGYIDERKNQKLLIQIGDELRKRGISDFVIWLIGDGPKRSEYEQLVEKLDLSKQVKFYGQQQTPWQLVAQTDLYVHTALNDNCPYSIIEAFAVKTPVLALPVGGIPEMLPDHFGLLQGTDVKALADEIATYFSPEKRTQLVNAQSAYAGNNFDHYKTLAKLISFYNQTGQAA